MTVRYTFNPNTCAGYPENRYTKQAAREIHRSLLSAPDASTEWAIIAWVERKGWLQEVAEPLASAYGASLGWSYAYDVRYADGRWWMLSTRDATPAEREREAEQDEQDSNEPCGSFASRKPHRKPHRNSRCYLCAGWCSDRPFPGCPWCRAPAEEERETDNADS